MQEVYDSIREMWVKATPEEVVRQMWLKRMITSLGYPKKFFAVEKELKTLPHLQTSTERIPDRRADIIFFSPRSLSPLILIECKVSDLSSASLQQVVGYNAFVRAPYMALVSEREIVFYNQDKKYPFMPSYEQLTKVLI